MGLSDVMCEVGHRHTSHSECPHLKYFRPLAVLVLGIVALYLLYLYITNIYFSPTQPLQPNRHHDVEHMIMKDSDIEDMDELEDLYLEQ